MGVDVARWRPWSSKSVGGCEQQASVGSTPIHSRQRISLKQKNGGIQLI